MMGALPGSREPNPSVSALPGFDPERSIVTNVCRLLRERPEEWEVGTHQIVHRTTDIHVWVANSSYGMEISKGWLGGRIWGGVTMLSSFGLSINHWRLYFAARTVVRAHYAAEMNRIFATQTDGDQ